LHVHPQTSPVHGSNLDGRLKSICARAGLPALAPYDLRHSYATAMLYLGVDRHVVSRMLGHATPAMTMYYEEILGEMCDDEASAFAKAFPLRWTGAVASRLHPDHPQRTDYDQLLDSAPP
jgi:integrase